MGQVNFEGLTKEWVPFDEIVPDFSRSKVYQVQNIGADKLIGLEVSEEPASDNPAGNPVLPNEVWTYEPEAGTMLYLRAFSNTCSVNITSK